MQHGCHRRGSFGGWAEEVGAAAAAPWSEMSEGEDERRRRGRRPTLIGDSMGRTSRQNYGTVPT